MLLSTSAASTAVADAKTSAASGSSVQERAAGMKVSTPKKKRKVKVVERRQMQVS